MDPSPHQTQHRYPKKRQSFKNLSVTKDWIKSLASLPSSKIEPPEKSQNAILRMILGCYRSTPISLMNIETRIILVSTRWLDRASTYIIKLSQKPWNPVYHSTKKLVGRKEACLPRAIPAIFSSFYKTNWHIKNFLNLEHEPCRPPPSLKNPRYSYKSLPYEQIKRH